MTDKKQEIHSISEIGEFKLIDELTKDIKLKNESSETGIGDDAAILNYEDKKVVITTDLLTEGIHFNLIYTPIKHLGYKAAVINFSDIYAMNAIPKQIVVSLAISNKFSKEAVEALYDGIKLACEKYNVDLVGGDTSSSLTGLTISITAIGEGDEDKLVYRSGAQKNDLICVSGNLGAAYMGIQILERERYVFENNPEQQPDLSNYSYILERQLKPEARKDIIEFLDEKNIIPTSMIDLSDGLSSDILQICKSSQCGCRIYQEKIPVDTETADTAKEMNIEPLVAALNGGEDYEMLFTVPVTSYERINSVPGISVIGHITSEKEGCYLITEAEQAVEIKAQGWDTSEQ